MLSVVFMGAGCPQSQGPYRERGRTHTVSCDPARKVTRLHFCNTLLATQVSLILGGKGPLRGGSARRIAEGCPGSCL